MTLHRAKNALRHLCVRAKYAFPLIASILVWVLSALPLWRFSRGDGEILENQTLFSMISQIGASVGDTLKKTNTESQDVILAKYLRPVPWIFWILMVLTLVSAAILFFFSLAAFAKDPESLECNRVKVKFRLFFPGQLWHILLPVLTALPMFIPYYIVNRFTKYYGASGLTETESGGTTYTYYDYSLKFDKFNPLIPVLIVAGIAFVLFFVAIPFERSRKMSMYRYYDPPETPEREGRHRN